MTSLAGFGVSDGIAIGRAVCIQTRGEEVMRFPLPAAAVEGELERLEEAMVQARHEVRAMGSRVGEEVDPELGAIFEVHALLLEDRYLRQDVERRIREERVNAEWAVWETVSEIRKRFAALGDERFRDRGQDLQDVGRHLIGCLSGVSHHELSEIEGDVIVIADDLTPSEAVRFGRQQVAGFVLEAGGRTSHTAIIAHSLNIPLVCGVAGISRLASSEDPVVVDGTRGLVILHPAPELLAEYQAALGRQRESALDLGATRGLPAETRDGVAVTLMANIDLLEEVDEAATVGAEGIGLYRSEFLYIEKSPRLPTEDEHYKTYRQLLEAMAPHPVVIRTFDLGGRKLAREVLETEEDNPVLGLRGIRLTLSRPEVFRPQLKGLFRAGCHGNLAVMLPLVNGVEEVRRFRELSATVMAELDEEGQPHCGSLRLGVMIEVPSAALIADHLAREVDFFSIGTNDLIQYSLAVDRNNENVATLYQPLHPAILRMIRSVVEQARGAGISVSVCGEAAGDPLVAPVLLGLGVRRLSVSPRRLPYVKRAIRELGMARLEAAARHACDLPTEDDIRRYLAATLGLGEHGLASPREEAQPT